MTDLDDHQRRHQRVVYQAIRSKDAERARAAMNEHLQSSSAYQAEEEQLQTAQGLGLRALSG